MFAKIFFLTATMLAILVFNVSAAAAPVKTELDQKNKLLLMDAANEGDVAAVKVCLLSGVDVLLTWNMVSTAMWQAKSNM